MDAHGTAERPYRSHLRPACIPCRRRKSRCQTETNASTCLMCKLHKSDCNFPDLPQASPIRPATRCQSIRQSNRNGRGSPAEQTRATTTRSSNRRTNTGTTGANSLQRVNSVPYPLFLQVPEEPPLGLSSAEDDNLNLHIVGPAATDDSRVLTDYLAGIPGAPRSSQLAVPVSSDRSKPVFFTTVQKRPLGFATHQSPAAEKLEIIEKLLEPSLDDIIET